MIKLETDLRSIHIASKNGEKASYVYACYTRIQLILRGGFHSLMPYSQTLPTFVHDVRVRRIEPGVFYRLPDVACRALGADESLSIIPLYVEIEHTPHVDFIEDEYGSAYVPYQASGVSKRIARCSCLSYGPWAVCGLLPTDQAREWAGLDDAPWQTRSLFDEVLSGLDPTWQPLRTTGSVVMSFEGPLLYRPVEAFRETV